MTQVQDMTDQQLNRELAELMGCTNFNEDTFGTVFCQRPDESWFVSLPEYCHDPIDSEQAQAAAIKLDAILYGTNLARLLEWENDSDPLSYSQNDLFSYNGVGVFLMASSRQRAEAAYMTLSQGGSES